MVLRRSPLSPFPGSGKEGNDVIGTLGGQGRIQTEILRGFLHFLNDARVILQEIDSPTASGAMPPDMEKVSWPTLALARQNLKRRVCPGVCTTPTTFRGCSRFRDGSTGSIWTQRETNKQLSDYRLQRRETSASDRTQGTLPTLVRRHATLRGGRTGAQQLASGPPVPCRLPSGAPTAPRAPQGEIDGPPHPSGGPRQPTCQVFSRPDPDVGGGTLAPPRRRRRPMVSRGDPPVPCRPERATVGLEIE